MNVPVVAAALSRLNNNSLRNKGGLCETISVLAAEALVSGQTPEQGAATAGWFSPGSFADEAGKHLVLNLPPDDPVRHVGQTRAFRVWSWLRSQAPRSVFVFAQDEDHCYNFVVNGDVFLIDAAVQLYRRVGTPGGASFFRDIPKYPYKPGFKTGHTKTNLPPSNTDYGFNYLSPQPLKRDDNLKVYDWGRLHDNWI